MQRADHLAREAYTRADAAARGIAQIRDTEGIWVGTPGGKPQFLPLRERPSAPPKPPSASPKTTTPSGEHTGYRDEPPRGGALLRRSMPATSR